MKPGSGGKTGGLTGRPSPSELKKPQKSTWFKVIGSFFFVCRFQNFRQPCLSSNVWIIRNHCRLSNVWKTAAHVTLITSVNELCFLMSCYNYNYWYYCLYCLYCVLWQIIPHLNTHEALPAVHVTETQTKTNPQNLTHTGDSNHSCFRKYYYNKQPCPPPQTHRWLCCVFLLR